VGWLYKRLPMSAGILRSMLEPLIVELPEMRRFVAEVPQAGRLLRPMCQMVGMRPPAWLALPKRVRVRGARGHPSPCNLSCAGSAKGPSGINCFA
jgi:hypothetical protein